MEKTLYNPHLSFVRPDYKGNKIINGKFTNSPWPDTNASLLNVIKWSFSTNPQRVEKKNENYRIELINNDQLFESKEDLIAWLGHASFFIRLNGINILIDPIIGNIPFIKRVTPFPISPNKICNIDYLLLSHGHRDHFDVPSLKKIVPQNDKAQLLGPLKIEKLVRDSGLKNIQVQEAGWYQQYETDKIKITYLPALHWHKRGLNDFNNILWGSFMIESEKIKIYFAADTAYGGHFKEIKETMRAPDICIMPIGAYKPSFLMKQSHMNPEEAIQAFKDLGGKYFIPMHYATFDLADEPIGEPIKLTKENLNPNALIELKPGESFFLNQKTY